MKTLTGILLFLKHGTRCRKGTGLSLSILAQNKEVYLLEGTIPL